MITFGSDEANRILNTDRKTAVTRHDSQNRADISRAILFATGKTERRHCGNCRKHDGVLITISGGWEYWCFDCGHEERYKTG